MHKYFANPVQLCVLPFRRKLSNKLNETETSLRAAENKVSNLEKTKLSLTAEVDELSTSLASVSMFKNHKRRSSFTSFNHLLFFAPYH